MTKSKPLFETASGYEYLLRMPKPGEVPSGKAIVHNHVKPSRILGSNGFRAWLETAPPASDRELCPCGWAPEIGPHYRLGEIHFAKGNA